MQSNSPIIDSHAHLDYPKIIEQLDDVIKRANKAGVKNIIFSSTAAVYGASKEKILSEMVCAKPISAYGSSKLFSEKILIDTCETQNLNYVIFRYFNVAGSDPKRRTGQVMKNATHLIKVACETALGKRSKMQIFGNDYDTKDGTCIRDEYNL